MQLHVPVTELVELPSGRRRLGNTVELPVMDAIAAVEAETHKATTHPIGVVPAEWLDLNPNEETN